MIVAIPPTQTTFAARESKNALIFLEAFPEARESTFGREGTFISSRLED
jgi:hypothetical protein